MLVAAGASLLVLDGAGLSSRQLALMAEDLELAEYLKSQEHFQVRQTSIKRYEKLFLGKLLKLENVRFAPGSRP